MCKLQLEDGHVVHLRSLSECGVTGGDIRDTAGWAGNPRGTRAQGASAQEGTIRFETGRNVLVLS